MSFFEFSMIYAMSWWMVFLMVLPMRVQMPEVPEGAAYPSAPNKVILKKKILITTVICIPISFIVGWVIYNKAVVQWLESLYS